MTKSIILFSILITAALSPVIVSADADSQYPAANFEPKVVFIDESASKHDSGEVSSKPSKAGSASKTEFDPQHPAAFFVPKVIYP